MRCSLSQNCTTRRSDTRLCTMPLGRIQSLGSIGSHTTRTRTDIEGLCSKISSIAEDPRKQYAHVGDRSRTSRVRSAELLNACRKVSRLPGVRDVSGGCPAGVRDAPQKYQKPKTATAAASRQHFVLNPMSQPANRVAITCGKSTVSRTTTTATQNSTRLNVLRFLH